MKKILSVLLLIVLTLSAVACGGGNSGSSNSSSSKSGTILTDMNVNNYLDFKLDEWVDYKTCTVSCKSKNSLFKFQDVTAEIEVWEDDKGNHKQRRKKKAFPITIDNNGNGSATTDVNTYIDKQFYCTINDLYVKVVSISGKVIE